MKVEVKKIKGFQRIFKGFQWILMDFPLEMSHPCLLRQLLGGYLGEVDRGGRGAQRVGEQELEELHHAAGWQGLKVEPHVLQNAFKSEQSGGRHLYWVPRTCFTAVSEGQCHISHPLPCSEDVPVWPRSSSHISI